MRRGFVIFLALALTFALVMGCSSGGGGGEVTLPQVQQPSAQSDHIGTYLWGSYQVVIDKNTHKVDIIQSRGADQMLNVVGFLEPPPLTNMNIDWDTLVIDDVNSYIGVDVILTHPIPDPVFDGFDVRGVCFGPEVTNADGYTVVMNPKDFADVPFGYINGLLGTPDSIGQYDTGPWGYKYFCDGLGVADDLVTFFSDETNLADRGVFRANGQNSRHYDLDWKNSVQDFFVFNYAIYANYEWPVGEAPIDLEDFPITANSSEAFCFTVTEVDNSLYWEDATTKGGTISLDAEVWDWQGLETTEVTIETDVVPDSSEAGNTSKSWIFHFVDYDPGDTLTTNEGLPLTFTVTDEKTFGEAWFLGLMDPGHALYGTQVYAVWKYTASVAPEAPSLGLHIDITGDLPGNLPTSNEKNFSVVGDNSFNRAGVYYHYSTGAGQFQVYKYPLDYSVAGSMYVNLTVNWFGWSNSQWLGSPAEMGYIEVNPVGAMELSTRAAQLMPGWYNEPLRRMLHIFGIGTGNPVNGWLVFNMKNVDGESDFAAQGTIWNFWNQDASNPAPGMTYKHAAPYGGGSNFLQPYFTTGGGDCQVDPANSLWYALDSDPEGTGSFDMVHAYLEGTGPTKVEIFENLSSTPLPTCLATLDASSGLVGNAKDISYLHNFGVVGFEDAVNNYLCVLEDNGDTSWQISTWEWNATTTSLDLVQRSDTVTNSTAYHLDCDSYNNKIHVWADEGGTMKYYVYTFS